MLSSDFLGFKVSSRHEAVGRLASKTGLLGFEKSRAQDAQVRSGREGDGKSLSMEQEG